jgi:hypothetical protein
MPPKKGLIRFRLNGHRPAIAERRQNLHDAEQNEGARAVKMRRITPMMRGKSVPISPKAPASSFAIEANGTPCLGNGLSVRHVGAVAGSRRT